MNSAAVVAGTSILATAYNNLRTDVTDLGHVQINAGAGGITQYDLVYISASNTILKADADSTTTAQVIGMAMETTGAGAATWVQCTGTVTNGAWALTAGQKVFLSTTAGGITQDAGSIIRTGKTLVEIGLAITATKILLRIKNV